MEAEFIIDDYVEVLIKAEITLVAFGKKVRKQSLRRLEKIAYRPLLVKGSVPTSGPTTFGLSSRRIAELDRSIA